ncbi:Macrolide-specific efflux protein macA precursor [Cedecea neteri]|uniref:Macrolide-specific efflux protein macA n=1 Tax=Cedecea neteri TaxID=158822 RepID=A0A2X2SWE8_9ENTR|nr:Macrolide-specific efflux protein macA precursor [Cedecea neteri]
MGKTKTREVTIGMRNDTEVQVVNGLEEGEEVVTGRANAGSSK